MRGQDEAAAITLRPYGTCKVPGAGGHQATVRSSAPQCASEVRQHKPTVPYSKNMKLVLEAQPRRQHTTISTYRFHKCRVDQEQGFPRHLCRDRAHASREQACMQGTATSIAHGGTASCPTLNRARLHAGLRHSRRCPRGLAVAGPT